MRNLLGPDVFRLFGTAGDHEVGASWIPSLVDGAAVRVLATIGEGWDLLTVSCPPCTRLWRPLAGDIPPPGWMVGPAASGPEACPMADISQQPRAIVKPLGGKAYRARHHDEALSSGSMAP